MLASDGDPRRRAYRGFCSLQGNAVVVGRAVSERAEWIFVPENDNVIVGGTLMGGGVCGPGSFSSHSGSALRRDESGLIDYLRIYDRAVKP